jgi:hypothetical protein
VVILPLLVLLLLLGGLLPGVGFRRRLDCRRLCPGRRRGLGSRPGFFRRLMDRSRRGIGGSLSLGGLDRRAAASASATGSGGRPPGARQPGTSRSSLASTMPGTANRSSSAAAADKSFWLGLLRCWRCGRPHRRGRACSYPRAPLGAPASWPLAVPEPARTARRLAAARAVAVARASS